MAKGTELAQVTTFAALTPFGETATGFDPSEVMAENLGGAGLSPSQLDKVKIPSGGGIAWEIPTLDGKGDIAKELTVIIVAKNEIRSFYASKYTGGNEAPDCYSIDCKTGVGKPGGQCAGCPNAEWGTAKDENGNPTNGQACKQRIMLLCISENSSLPFLINAPTTSLKTLHAYFMRLAGANLPFYGVVTSLKLAKGKSGGGIDHSVIEPEWVRNLTVEEIPGIRAYRANLLPMFNLVSARPDQDEE